MNTTTQVFSPLDYDPFEGDFGGPGDKIFSDAMVKARKQYVCCHCEGPLVVGEIHRSRYEKADGEMMSHRWCASCCAAMVKEMEIQNGEDELAKREPSRPVEPVGGLGKAVKAARGGDAPPAPMRRFA